MATVIDLPLPDTPQEIQEDLQQFNKFDRIYDAFRVLRDRLPEYFITVADLPAGNGILVRTGTNTWELRTLTGTAGEIDVDDGDGVAGNPKISLPDALVFTGKTIAGGQFNGGDFNGTLGAVIPSTGVFDNGTAVAPSIKFAAGPGLYYDAGLTHFSITDGAIQRVAFALQGTGNTGLEMGRTDGSASLVFIDFHTGATAIDQDARIIVQNGTGVIGAARMDIVCGQLTVSPGGSAAAPSIARTTDLDTGIFWPSANMMSFSANSVRLANLTGTGVDFLEGISFGSTDAASSTDLSSHIALFGTTSGIGISSGRMNFVLPNTSDFVFLTNTGIDLMRIDTASRTVDIGPDPSTQTVNLQLGNGRTGNGFSIIDLVGDATHTNFGLRLLRGDTGANAVSEILHKGTGALILSAEDASGSIQLETNNVTRATMDTSGVFTIGANVSFDQVAANDENPTISQFIVTNGSDGRHRKASKAHAMQEAGAYHRLATTAIATGTNTTTLNLPTTRDWAYVDVIIRGLTAGTDFEPYLRINADSTVGNYRYANHSWGAAAGAAGTNGSGVTPGCWCLYSAAGLVEATNNNFNCTIRIWNPRSTTVRKSAHWHSGMAINAADGLYYGIQGEGAWLSTSAITSFVLHIQNTAAATISGSGVNATAGTMEIWGAF